MSPTSRRRRGPDQGHRDAAREHVEGSAELETLAARLAPLVAARLAAMLAGAAEPATYSTRKEGPRPPEFADRARAWRELAPMIPGAVRLGRWWSVPRAAFERWRDGQSTTSVPAPAPASAWSPADMARDLGLRLVKGATR